jgi:hypothetical protein
MSVRIMDRRRAEGLRNAGQERSLAVSRKS